MLAGIYYGAMYGGSTTSILVNVPGEAGSVVTLLDGYQMTRKGRAGAALAVAAVGSFVAGTVGVVGIMFAASWLADVAVRFGPPEYFAITLGGILLLSRLSSASLTHAFVLVAVGLAVGTIGMDPVSALRRFTYGSVSLSQGVELVPVIMGLYGVAEVLVLAEEGAVRAQIASVRLRELFPTREEWRRSAAPIARGSVPGAARTAAISSISAPIGSSNVERRLPPSSAPLSTRFAVRATCSAFSPGSSRDRRRCSRHSSPTRSRSACRRRPRSSAPA